MASPGTVTVKILGDASHVNKVFGDVSDGAGRLGHMAANAAKVAALGVAAVGVAGVAVGKQLYDAAIESQKVTKQTEAVLASMGDAANVTADQVSKLSTELSNKTAVDDELIQSGANVLLTFGKVRNEVGEGNAIFDRATEAALDMSVALGTDMQAASVMLGKALNDPIKGITAMSRAGVSFTEQQKDQIKAMVEAGDTLGAQKIIMAEMEKQFGGSAAAQSTGLERLQVVWGNLQEQLGTHLIPIVERVASWLGERLPGAIAGVEAAVTRWWPVMVGAFGQVSAVVDQVRAKVEEWWPVVVAAFGQVVAFVEAHWPTVQKIITDVISAVVAVVSGAVAVLTVVWENFGNNVLTFVQRIWPSIQQVIGGALDAIRGVVQVITSLIQGDWAGVWEGIKGIASGAWDAVQGIVKGGLEVIYGVIGVAGEIIGSLAKGMWDGIKNAFRDAINWVIRAWNGLEFKIPGFKVGPVGYDGFTLGVPDIPRLHQGGVFQAPVPGGEGLAILRDGERVTRPGAGGSGAITINFNAPIYGMHDFEKAVQDAVVQGSARSGGWPIRLRSAS